MDILVCLELLQHHTRQTIRSLHIYVAYINMLHTTRAQEDWVMHTCFIFMYFDYFSLFEAGANAIILSVSLSVSIITQKVVYELLCFLVELGLSMQNNHLLYC